METMNQLMVSYNNRNHYNSFSLSSVHIPVASSDYCNSSPSIALTITQSLTSSVEMSVMNLTQDNDDYTPSLSLSSSLLSSSDCKCSSLQNYTLF